MKGKRFISSVLAVMTFWLSSGASALPVPVLALDNVNHEAAEYTLGSSLSDVTLGTVTNLYWKSNSTATAKWDAVDGANYYYVTVYLYYNNALLGSTKTGTANTELDVQQEIYDIIGDRTDVKTVHVCYSVCCAFRDENNIEILGEESGESDTIGYIVNYKDSLPSPQNVIYDKETYTVSWDDMEEAGSYSLLYTYYEFSDFGGGPYEYEDFISLEEIKLENGRRSYSIENYILNMQYSSYSVDIDFYLVVYPSLEYEDQYTKSSVYFTSFSYTPPAVPEKEYFPEPKNVIYDKETYTVSWDDMEDAGGYGLYYYYYEFYPYGGGPYDCENYISLEETKLENGRRSYSIESIIPDEGGYSYDVEYHFFILAYPSDEYEEQYKPSNKVYFTSYYYTPPAVPEKERFPEPKNIEYDEASFTVSWDDMEDAGGYGLFYYCYENNSYGGGMYEYENYISLEETKLENGRRSYSIENYIPGAGSYTDYVNLEFSLFAYPSDEYSDQYKQSNSVWFASFTNYPGAQTVKKITLSPDSPILYKGNSLFLGKTIAPTNAYYSTIDWSTSDETIVSVNENGRITANSVGTAEITAKIGQASDTVSVTVYDISSNIDDEGEKKDVTGTAGGIIDDIVNNDDPDIGKTDIPEGELEDVKQDIQEGIWRGDEFFTDVKWYEENFGKYKNNWGQIQKAARELNAQFAGAYNIEVEMYHKDKEGTDYHIGNITQLENEVTFTFDLPTGMKETESGVTRKYVLVRIHNNQMDTVMSA